MEAPKTPSVWKRNARVFKWSVFGVPCCSMQTLTGGYGMISTDLQDMGRLVLSRCLRTKYLGPVDPQCASAKPKSTGAQNTGSKFHIRIPHLGMVNPKINLMITYSQCDNHIESMCVCVWNSLERWAAEWCNWPVVSMPICNFCRVRRCQCQYKQTPQQQQLHIFAVGVQVMKNPLHWFIRLSK